MEGKTEEIEECFAKCHFQHHALILNPWPSYGKGLPVSNRGKVT